MKDILHNLFILYVWSTKFSPLKAKVDEGYQSLFLEYEEMQEEFLALLRNHKLNWANKIKFE